MSLANPDCLEMLHVDLLSALRGKRNLELNVRPPYESCAAMPVNATAIPIESSSNKRT